VIAALFVQKDGVYFGLPNVDPWDQRRDARLYGGPWPVIAHPPCERWGRYWDGGPAARGTCKLGDDDGKFEAALMAVRRHGGILEHPEASNAWRHFGLIAPPRHGGWVVADFEGGWTCCIDQGEYGHKAAKATWLYAHGVDLPSLRWGRSGKRLEIGPGDDRARLIKTGVCQRLSKRQRAATPIEFRDLLILIAQTAQGKVQAA
jgi:hypothetical protein